MKTAIVIAGATKQIMLSPETEEEKTILKLIGKEEQNLDIIVREGSFYPEKEAFGYDINFCRGGYLRAFATSDNLMLVLTPKETQQT